MENYMNQAFVTSVAFHSSNQQTHHQPLGPNDYQVDREDRVQCAKLSDDISALQMKVSNLREKIDFSCYVTQKALDNLALERVNLTIDLHEMREKMCLERAGKTNYLRFLGQLMGKLNSLLKEIKKINKFQGVNVQKRPATIGGQSPKKYHLEARYQLPYESLQKSREWRKKDIIEEMTDKYAQAIRAQIQYRQKFAAYNDSNSKAKENIRELNIKRVKKVKLLNKKVDQIYQKQKDKEGKQFDSIISRRMQTIEALSTIKDYQNRPETDYREVVERNRKALEQQLDQKRQKLMVKLNVKAFLTSASLRGSNIFQSVRRLQQTKQRKKMIEAEYENVMIQKFIQKEQKIKKIQENGKKQLSRSAAQSKDDKDKVPRIKTKLMSAQSDRQRLKQHISQSQSKVELKRQQLLKEMSDLIRQKFQQKWQRHIKKYEQNRLVMDQKMSSIEQRHAITTNKIKLSQVKAEKIKESAIRQKFTDAIKRHECQERILGLRNMPLEALLKRTGQPKDLLSHDFYKNS